MEKERKDGKHTHACKCGTTWEHGNNCSEQGEDAYEKAHTCPSCGELVYLGYHGESSVGQANVEHPVNCAPGPRVQQPVEDTLQGLFAAILGLEELAEV